MTDENARRGGSMSGRDPVAVLRSVRDEMTARAIRRLDALAAADRMPDPEFTGIHDMARVNDGDDRYHAAKDEGRIE